MKTVIISPRRGRAAQDAGEKQRTQACVMYHVPQPNATPMTRGSRQDSVAPKLELIVIPGAPVSVCLVDHAPRPSRHVRVLGADHEALLEPRQSTASHILEARELRLQWRTGTWYGMDGRGGRGTGVISIPSRSALVSRHTLACFQHKVSTGASIFCQPGEGGAAYPL